MDEWTAKAIPLSPLWPFLCPPSGHSSVPPPSPSMKQNKWNDVTDWQLYSTILIVFLLAFLAGILIVLIRSSPQPFYKPHLLFLVAGIHNSPGNPISELCPSLISDGRLCNCKGSGVSSGLNLIQNVGGESVETATQCDSWLVYGLIIDGEMLQL